MPIKKTTEQFIRDAVIKHGNKYDYSLVEYVGTHSKVKILCPSHGEFEQLPMDHIKGRGCSNCGKISSASTRRKQQNAFIEEATRLHNNKYDYVMVDYQNTCTKVKIICPNHGEFEQLPMNHLKLVGCPKCKTSKGETTIIRWLELADILYVREYRVPELGQKRFDFFLPKHNTFVEFDGIQHYQSYEKFGGPDGLRTIQESDSIKTKYCSDNQIKLVRIPYWKLNKISEIMTEAGILG